MKYYDPSKISLKNDGIYYIDRKISFAGFKYAYISGYYSPNEYSDNLGCYEVRLRIGNNTYILCETCDKGTAKSVVSYVQKQVGGKKGIKKYNNALVNLDAINDVKLESDNGQKVKINIKNGRILRVYRSAFKLPAQITYNKIKSDLEKFRVNNPVR